MTDKETITMFNFRALGFAILAALISPGPSFAQAAPTEADAAGLHDFDFVIGNWRVHHRRLKAWLEGSDEWIEFDGTSVTRKLMGGYANVEDNVLDAPTGSYRGVALRSFDAKSGQWSIWWLDGKSPLGPLDPPVRGKFKDGVGAFYSDYVFNGKPVVIRYLWSANSPTSLRWEQALSTDKGASWETNWVMEFTRAP